MYEARGRVGGRMLSRVGMVEPGIVDDFGGSFVNTDHTDLRALLREFDHNLYDRRTDPAAWMYARPLGSSLVARSMRPRSPTAYGLSRTRSWPTPSASTPTSTGSRRSSIVILPGSISTACRSTRRASPPPSQASRGAGRAQPHEARSRCRGRRRRCGGPRRRVGPDARTARGRERSRHDGGHRPTLLHISGAGLPCCANTARSSDLSVSPLQVPTAARPIV